MIYAVYALIGLSLLFALFGVIGMLRMPDSYCRMQASTIISTLGMLGVILGGLLYAAFILKDTNMAVKLGVLGVFYLITAPISGHAIAKAAYAHKVKRCEQTVCDQLKEDLDDEA